MLPFPLIRSIATLCGETAILCTNKAIRGGFAWSDRLELAMREAKTLNKNTLFRMQCDLGAMGTCERMLDNEADAVSMAAMLLAKPPNYSGETALIGGCKQGNVSLVEILIRNSPNEQFMDGDAELDALLSQHPAARAAYDRRIKRLSPTRTWTDVVIRALATLVNSPMDEQQFAKALLEEFVIGATTQNIDAMNGLVRGMFTGVRRNCSTTMLEVDDATAVTLKSGAVPNSSARSLWTQLTSWR
eukprot:gene5485-biopygen4713